MALTSDSVKPNRSSTSNKEMKKKSLAALRNTNYCLVIRSNDKLVAAKNIEAKGPTEVIIIHERKSHSKTDINKDSNGKTIQENKEDTLLQKKSLSKNDINNDDCKGDGLKESISNPKSTHEKSSQSNTSTVQKHNKQIIKIIDSSKNDLITFSTRMTRSKLRKLLATEPGKNASDYLSGMYVQSLRKVGQRKRPGIPLKSSQAKKMKNV